MTPATSHQETSRIFPIAMGIWCAVVLAAWIVINVAANHTPTFSHLWPPDHPYWFNVLYATAAIPFVWLAAWSASSIFGRVSLLGRACLCMGLGVVSWSIGNTIWFWYNSCARIAHAVPGLGCSTETSTPYPSLADIGFLGMLPLWAAGLILLWRMLAVRWSDVLHFWWLVCLIALITCYLTVPTIHVGSVAFGHSWLFSADYTSAQEIFSSVYIASDVVLLSMALILLIVSRQASGGMLFRPMLVTSASIVVLYFADMVFDYRASAEKYFNGDASDGLYFLSLAGMIVALRQFSSVGRRMHQSMAALEELNLRESDDRNVHPNDVTAPASREVKAP